MRLAALAANAGFAGLQLGSWRRFRRALDEPRGAQLRLLAAYLKRNAETDFGRRHGFSSIRSPEEYRDRVPIRSYDDYGGYVDRVAAGEPRVLTGQPVEMLEWSSGSTRAAKLIPFTGALRAEFRRAVGAWMTDVFMRDPALMGGPAYWSISPAYDPPEADETAIPVGPMSDGEYLGGRMARLVDATFAVPAAVSRIRDVDDHRRVTLLHLLGCRELRLISVWHPTFLTLLVAGLSEQWDALVADVASGLTAGPAGVPVPPRPGRAEELDRIGPRDLAAVWPRLRLISCWTDGPARRSAGALRDLFPGVAIQGKGLLATEGVVSIPFRDTRPLALTSHYLEFVDDVGRARSAWELEEGMTCSVILTTGGGLYRYALHDRVRVTGFVGRAPCVEFLGKEDHVSDLRGEKLEQSFVQTAIDRSLAEHGTAAVFAMLAPDERASPPSYVLFVSAQGELPRGLAATLETELRRNPHYAHCVRLGQLSAAGVVSVGTDAAQRYVRHAARSGRRLGDVKPTALSPSSGWRAVLLEDRAGGS